MPLWAFLNVFSPCTCGFLVSLDSDEESEAKRLNIPLGLVFVSIRRFKLKFIFRTWCHAVPRPGHESINARNARIALKETGSWANIALGEPAHVLRQRDKARGGIYVCLQAYGVRASIKYEPQQTRKQYNKSMVKVGRDGYDLNLPIFLDSRPSAVARVKNKTKRK